MRLWPVPPIQCPWTASSAMRPAGSSQRVSAPLGHPSCDRRSQARGTQRRADGFVRRAGSGLPARRLGALGGRDGARTGAVGPATVGGPAHLGIGHVLGAWVRGVPQCGFRGTWNLLLHVRRFVASRPGSRNDGRTPAGPRARVVRTCGRLAREAPCAPGSHSRLEAKTLRHPGGAGLGVRRRRLVGHGTRPDPRKAKATKKYVGLANTLLLAGACWVLPADASRIHHRRAPAVGRAGRFVPDARSRCACTWRRTC